MHRPSRAAWTAWALALAGGLAVLVAALLMLLDGCAQGGACSATRLQVATALTVGGTGLAAVGACAATALTVRQVRRALPPRA